MNWPKPQIWYTGELRWTPGGMWPQACLIHSWKRPCWSAQASYSLTFRRASERWNRDRKWLSILLKTIQQTSAELKPEPTFPDSRPGAHTPQTNSWGAIDWLTPDFQSENLAVHRRNTLPSSPAQATRIGYYCVNFLILPEWIYLELDFKCASQGKLMTFKSWKELIGACAPFSDHQLRALNKSYTEWIRAAVFPGLWNLSNWTGTNESVYPNWYLHRKASFFSWRRQSQIHRMPVVSRTGRNQKTPVAQDLVPVPKENSLNSLSKHLGKELGEEHSIERGWNKIRERLDNMHILLLLLLGKSKRKIKTKIFPESSMDHYFCRFVSIICLNTLLFFILAIVVFMCMIITYMFRMYIITCSK